VARERPDVVQFCQPPDLYFPLAMLCRRLGIRVLVDQRDLLPELWAARYGPPRPALLALLRRLERLSLTWADRVTCVNDYLLKRALSAGAIAAERITVIRNGPVLARVTGVRPEPSLRQGHQFLACWVGIMGRQDRLDLLLQSVQHLVHKLGRTDTRFVIIGFGEYLEQARALCSELGLDEWVEFTGPLPVDQVFRYLASADLGLDASLQFEVSPVKVMEYMAFGVPVVAFDLPETRRLCQGAAVFAPPGDVAEHARTIDALLTEPARRAELGQVGRARVRDDLAWEHQAVRYLDVIERLRQAA
jgi:glycosyltransferase involved in cell wall biosynthesis